MPNKRMHICLWLAAGYTTALFAQPPAQTAGAPRLVKYSGALADAAGKPLTGTLGVTFSFYAEQEGGAPIWMETQNVEADGNGQYTVLLGSTRNAGIPAGVFAGPRWLGIQVQSQAERPRVLMTSVPYALKSVDAETLGGLPASAFVLAAPDNRGPGGAEVAGRQGKSLQPSVQPDALSGSGTADYIAIWKSASKLGSSAIYQTTAGSVGIGTTSPTATLQVVTTGSTGMLGEATAISGTNYGVYGSAASSSGFGVYGSNASGVGVEGVTASTTTGFAGVVGAATATSGGAYGVYGSAAGTIGAGVVGTASSTTGSNFGVYGNAVSASGTGVAGVTSGPTGYGVYGANSATTGSAYGVFGQTSSTAGVAVLGQSSATSGSTFGVYGETASPSGIAVEGQGGSGTGVAGASSSGTAYGVYGANSSTSGAANGVYGVSYSSTGAGVTGVAQATSGSNFGVYGAVESPNGVAVNGVGGSGTGVAGSSSSGTAYGVYGANISTTGAANGVYGASSSTAGTGVTGVNVATSGTNYGLYGNAVSPSGVGVSANATGGGTALVATASGSGIAAKFTGPVKITGNLTVTGTVSKGGGSFRIDDPIDPEHKYLYHSFVESPDMMNIYNGVVTLSHRGDAVVKLPEWFQALNRDFRYQLTCIGGFAPVYIAREVSGNQFKIAGGHAGMKVSWQVTGIRKDTFANEHRIPVEENKPATE